MGKFSAETFNNYFLQFCSKSQYPKRKLPVEYGSLDKSGIGSSREIQTSSKYHFHQRKNERKRAGYQLSFCHFRGNYQLAFLSDKIASQASDIPVKIIKKNRDLTACFILHNSNNALSSSEYPAGLKYADMTPIFKKVDQTDKTNCRPISILPNLSKTMCDLCKIIYIRIKTKYSQSISVT